MKLTFDDFQLLDHVITKNGSLFTIGLKNDENFITREKAFKEYQNGQLLSKTVDIDGEPVFEDLK